MSIIDDEFDIIFAGGGATGCLVAGRLAAADPSLRILIVEAGPHIRDDPQHVTPALFNTHFESTKTMRFVASPSSPHLDGRANVVPTAHCVGGGSSVHFVMYTRASPSDYDDWETKYSNPGWGFKELLPFLKKTETYQINPVAETHGGSGPLKVSWGGRSTLPNVARAFLDVAAQYDKGRKFTEDANDMLTVNAYGRWPKWIDRDTGRRADVPHFFIYNQKDNNNLQVRAGYLVKRAILKDGRAVGVEYVPNPEVHPDASPEIIKAYAKKLVVISVGSLGSPCILERSGIGAASVLAKAGVHQVADLPGVGERCQDHQMVVSVFRASEDSETMDAIFNKDPVELHKWTTQWLKDGTGMLATNGFDAGIRLRPSEAELDKIGPAFREKWDAYYANAPDKAVMWFGCPAYCFGTFSSAPKGKYFGCGAYINHPSSMGHIHITSRDDVFAPPDFVSSYLDNDADMELHVFAYKRAREFGRRMACYRGEYPAQHPDFAKDSPAAVNENPTPIPIDAPNVEYTKDDDEAIRTFIRKFVVTTCHSLGTCAMMPRGQGGVVDPHLNVYGVKGLKVADLSIAPFNVGANTYSTVLAIGEKAAMIIGEELGIEKV